MFGGAGFAILTGLHYWFPKMFGRMYDQRRAKLRWLVLFVGFQFLYFSMFILGYKGMPRRYFDYPAQFRPLNIVSTVGSWILVTGLVIIFGNLIRALFKGERAPSDPWGGKTLEWRIPSPPPPENFRTPPVVSETPYDYGPD
jgi:cytochrome c oxidase subunit I